MGTAEMSNLFWPSILLLLALSLTVMEAFIPSGGVLAVAAALAFIASITTAFMYGGLQTGTLFMAGTGVLLPLLVWLLIKWWPKTPFGRRILIQPPRADELLPPQHASLKQLVGRHGTALTAMLPAGAIRIEGRTIDAISEGMSIEKNSPIEVIAVRGNHLVVRPLTASTEPPANPPSSPSADTVLPDPFDDSLS